MQKTIKASRKNDFKKPLMFDGKIDNYNYFAKTPFQTVLKLFAQDKRFVYPVAIAVAHSVINQNCSLSSM